MNIFVWILMGIIAMFVLAGFSTFIISAVFILFFGIFLFWAIGVPITIHYGSNKAVYRWFTRIK